MERRRAIIVAVALVAVAALAGLAISLSRSSPPPEAKDTPSSANTSEPETSAEPDSGDSVPAVISPEELASAHSVMRNYLVAVGTYTYQTDEKAWKAKAQALTDGSKSMSEQTSLPADRAWADCVKTKCSSTATAHLERDTVLSNAPVDGAGRSVTTLASTAVTLHQDKSSTQSTDFAITATYTSGEWKISGLQLAGVGNAGISEHS